MNLNGSFRLRCTAAQRRFYNNQINGRVVSTLQQMNRFRGSTCAQNNKPAAVQNRIHGMSTIELTIENDYCFH